MCLFKFNIMKEVFGANGGFESGHMHFYSILTIRDGVMVICNVNV